MYRHINKTFFEQWSSEMAYVLGFFTADGSMYETKRGTKYLDFTSTDREIIEQIKKALESEHKIVERKMDGNKCDIYRLQVGSKKMFGDLLKLGFQPCKTKCLPSLEVPDEHFGDFVRGYFDGDGNVYFKKHYVKARGKKKPVFKSRFISSDLVFLKSLHKQLKDFGIGKGFIQSKERGNALVLSHRDSVALFALMYNNSSCSLRMKRKYHVFKNAIQEMYGEDRVNS